MYLFSTKVNDIPKYSEQCKFKIYLPSSLPVPFKVFGTYVSVFVYNYMCSIYYYSCWIQIHFIFVWALLLLCTELHPIFKTLFHTIFYTQTLIYIPTMYIVYIKVKSKLNFLVTTKFILDFTSIIVTVWLQF